MSRFDYVAYDSIATANQLAFISLFQQIDTYVEAMVSGRAKALVLTKLEEAYMWIGKAIRDDQIQRNGNAPLQDGYDIGGNI